MNANLAAAAAAAPFPRRTLQLCERGAIPRSKEDGDWPVADRLSISRPKSEGPQRKPEQQPSLSRTASHRPLGIQNNWPGSRRSSTGYEHVPLSARNKLVGRVKCSPPGVAADSRISMRHIAGIDVGHVGRSAVQLSGRRLFIERRRQCYQFTVAHFRRQKQRRPGECRFYSAPPNASRY